MKYWTDIFVLLTSLGTMIAGIAAWLSVFEMKKQRKDLLKPELTVTNAEFLVNFDRINNLPELRFGDKKFRLLNVGNGNAKFINIIYGFNYYHCINILEENNEYDNYFAEITPNGIKTLKNGYFPLEDQIVQGSLMTVNQQLELPLPHTYMEFLKAMIDFSLKSQKIGYSDFPKLEVEISYRDSEKESIKREYLIEPKLRNTTVSHIDGEIDYSGHLILIVNEKE